jgi:hypothetical protein
MTTLTTLSFEKALDALPDVCGFDSFSHKTVEDLCYLCLHELDLHAEREYWHPVAVRKKLLAFCKKFGYYETQAQEMFTAGNGFKKADAYM